MCLCVYVCESVCIYINKRCRFYWDVVRFAAKVIRILLPLATWFTQFHSHDLNKLWRWLFHTDSFTQCFHSSSIHLSAGTAATALPLITIPLWSYFFGVATECREPMWWLSDKQVEKKKNLKKYGERRITRNYSSNQNVYEPVFFIRK